MDRSGSVPICSHVGNATLMQVLKNLVGTRRLELLTSTVSKSKYSVIQQLTGYLGLPKSLIIRHHPGLERNWCGTAR